MLYFQSGWFGRFRPGQVVIVLSMLFIFCFALITSRPVTGRAINPDCEASCGGSSLLINEIDYDQPSTDTAEFIELKNVSLLPIDLDSYTVELVNGSGGGAVIYKTIDLPAVSLPAEAYYVICANPATVSPCDLDSSPDSDLVQNGARCVYV